MLTDRSANTIVQDSGGREYQRVNGTHFDLNTPVEVINALENARLTNRRIKIHYGDVRTGRDWHEENDVTGYVGRSAGMIKIPLLVFNNRSYGGSAILDHCIVKISTTRGGRVLYQHPMYKPSRFEIVPGDIPDYSHSVLIDGVLTARFQSRRAAENYVKKMSK